MNFIYRYFLILSIIFSSGYAGKGVFGQRANRQFELAQQKFNAGKYAEAEQVALNILKNDSSFHPAYLFLADLYRKTDSTRKEASILKTYIHFSRIGNPLIYYRLGKANYLSSDYLSALTWFGKYLEQQPNEVNRNKEVQRWIANCNFAIAAMKNPVDFNPYRLGNEINSVNDEYWPSLTIDSRQLVFTRLMKQGSGLNYLQEDFYISIYDSNRWMKAVPITEVNTNGNEGAQSVSADGKWLFFTACERPDGIGSCDIFFSRNIGGKWSKPRPVGGQINTIGWEGQPSVSANGDFIYYSSSRPGGKGGKDIWRSRLENVGTDGIPQWGRPENLGDSINTPGDEISPFIHPNGSDLFFASDFWPGMGGLDIFCSELKNNNSWSNPRNLGFPLNSIRNEQGLVINASGETAFFSSGREKFWGMDIYSFKLDKQFRPQPVTYIKAKVIDDKSGNSVQAEVILMNFKDSTSNQFTTDPDGEIFTCLPVGSDYAFNVMKEGYLFYSRNFPLSESKSFLDPYNLIIRLSRLEKGQKMNLYNVFFETNSAVLMPESFPELERLRLILAENPLLKIEIQGHTDDIGTKEFNQSLSEKRAKSVFDYLVNNKISATRLISKGFGLEMPVGPNDTEEGRRKNRRTTIVILDENYK